MSSENYEVEIVDRAFDCLLGLRESPYERTVAILDLLASNPEYGRVYEPDYDATLPPVTCRRIAVPKTTIELFYYIDEVRRKIKVIHVGDARMDPRRKLLGLHPSEYE